MPRNNDEKDSIKLNLSSIIHITKYSKSDASLKYVSSQNNFCTESMKNHQWEIEIFFYNERGTFSIDKRTSF